MPGPRTDGASWDRVKAVFQAALDREPSARPSFLREACGGDLALQAEVDAEIRDRKPVRERYGC